MRLPDDKVPDGAKSIVSTLGTMDCGFVLRAKLARNRGTHPLFDTARFTRHIEAAYTTMWQRYQNGEPPRAFAVGSIS
jgi:hypothetical protein